MNHRLALLALALLLLVGGLFVALHEETVGATMAPELAPDRPFPDALPDVTVPAASQVERSARGERREVPAGPPVPRGFSIRVDVATTTGAPVRDAEVTVVYAGAHGDELFGIARTDARGRIELDAAGVRDRVRAHQALGLDELREALAGERPVLIGTRDEPPPFRIRLLSDAPPAPKPERERIERAAQPRLLLRVRCTGFRDCELAKLLPSREDLLGKNVLLRVRLIPGEEWKGRVLSPAGDAIAGAVLHFEGESWDPNGQRPLREATRDVHCDAAGRFRFGPPTACFTRLQIVEPGVGHLDLALEGAVPENGRDFGDLVLVSLLQVTGRVVAEDGTPLPGLPILVSGRDSFPRGMIRSAVGELEERTQELTGTISTREGGGHAKTVTDRAGRFTVDGLTPGTFEIRLAPDELRGTPRVFLAEDVGLGLGLGDWRPREDSLTFIVSAGEDVTLRAPGQWLVLSARDSTGEEMGGVRVERFTPDPDPSLEAEHWPWISRSPIQLRETPGPSCYRFELEEPQQMRLRASRPDLPSVDAVLELHPGVPAVVHVFEFLSRDSFGSLRVRVRTGDGQPLPNSSVTLYPDDTWAVDENVDTVVCDADGRIEHVTPGRYLVFVEPGRTTALSSYWIPVPVEEVIEIHPGRETVLDVTAGVRGGRIELSVTAEEEAQDSIWGTSFSRAFYGATPLDAGNLEQGVYYLRFLGTDEDDSMEVDAVLPGQSATSDPPLPPGRYEFLVHHSGYQEERTIVDIRAGRTTAVHVHLRPDED